MRTRRQRGCRSGVECNLRARGLEAASPCGRDRAAGWFETHVPLCGTEWEAATRKNAKQVMNHLMMEVVVCNKSNLFCCLSCLNESADIHTQRVVRASILHLQTQKMVDF